MDSSEEILTVSYIEGDNVFLKTASTSSCGSCSAQSSCGSLSFFKKPASNLCLPNTLNLKAGDSVVLSMATDKLLFGSIIMYLLPLISLFLFAIIGKLLGNELTSITLGLLGLLGSMFFIKKAIRASKTAKKFEPKLIRKVIDIHSA